MEENFIYPWKSLANNPRYHLYYLQRKRDKCLRDLKEVDVSVSSSQNKLVDSVLHFRSEFFKPQTFLNYPFY